MPSVSKMVHYYQKRGRYRQHGTNDIGSCKRPAYMSSEKPKAETLSATIAAITAESGDAIDNMVQMILVHVSVPLTCLVFQKWYTITESEDAIDSVCKLKRFYDKIKCRQSILKGGTTKDLYMKTIDPYSILITL
jgi:hypothetical protein